MTDIQNIAAEPLDRATDEELVEQAYEMMAGGQAAEKPQQPKGGKWQKWKANFKRRGWILLFILPALVYVIIFCYVPMYGILFPGHEYELTEISGADGFVRDVNIYRLKVMGMGEENIQIYRRVDGADLPLGTDSLLRRSGVNGEFCKLHKSPISG